MMGSVVGCVTRGNQHYSHLTTDLFKERLKSHPQIWESGSLTSVQEVVETPH